MRSKEGTSQTPDPIRLMSKLRANSLLTASAPPVLAAKIPATNAVHKNMSALIGNPGKSRAVECPPTTQSGTDMANIANKKVHGKPGQVHLVTGADVSGVWTFT
jgi:hypothetical protein